ncbi:hypothetical protein C100_14500 [Sphingobium sp. C100]|uniref:hypothetical protein n=1 Tax=Sphingobium sp. C100 TaxID=1207055 RepID=UPI0003D68566|nr:hypothetical protein [Sphingobium sp. C100]ETI63080.1 hypothetical protein C100_14500 [Sphingobium sp. C100]
MFHTELQKTLSGEAMGQTMIARRTEAAFAAGDDAAASWIMATYAGVQVNLTDTAIELSGVTDADSLLRIWRAALLNRKLLDQACSRRAMLLENLLS